VEVTVVVVVIAIAAAVVGPTLWRPGARGEAAAVAALAEIHATAREAAVIRGGQAEARLRPEDGRWIVLARSGRSEDWDTVASGVMESSNPDFELIGRGWAVVRFDARGRAAGDEVVVLGDDGLATLRPDPWVGVLHVARR